MSSTQERIKKRREYLKKKAEAYLTVYSILSLSVPTSLIGLLICVYAVAHFLKHPSFITSILIYASIFVVLFGGLTTYMIGKLHKQFLQVPYVPPVTVATLPAEEVLVRGSEQPAQEQSRVLLRVTDSSAGTGEQELLRGSQGHGRAGPMGS